MEQKKNTGMQNPLCPCKKKSCKRHGDCEACIAYHAQHKRYPPFCKRSARKNGEKEQ